jgi:hypothetical protein
LSEIRSCVEGAVEGCLQRAGQTDESAGAFDVDGAICAEDAENDSADSKSQGVMKFFTDRIEVGGGVVEAVCMGAQHDMDRQTASVDGLCDEFVIGSQAAYVECGAEFDAVGSALPCCEAGVQGFGTEFEDDRAAQKSIDSSGEVPRLAYAPVARNVNYSD